MKHIFCKMLAALMLTALATGCSAPAEKHFDVKNYEYAMGEKYFAQWNAEENARIDRDIEKYRKADGVFALDVPAGTEVQVEQTRHAFYFGAHIFDFNQLPSDEANAKHQAMWKELFNSATIPFYWKDYEPEPGVYRDDVTPDNTPEFWQNCKDPWKYRFYRKPAIRPVLDFCDANHVRKHGHPLVWGCNKTLPKWYLDAIPKEITESDFFKKEFHYNDPATKTLGWFNYWCVTGKLTEQEFAEKYPDYCKFVNEATMNRIINIGEKYGDRFDSWDVVNESVIDTVPHEYLGTAPRMVPGGKITKSCYGAMPGDYVFRSFAVAAEHLPAKAWLNINDVPYGEKNAPYVKQIRELLARGAKIDVIGCQMHIFHASDTEAIAKGEGELKGESGDQSPALVRATMEPLMAIGKPMHLSEITIMAPGNDARGEAIQAVIAYNLYRLWFSLPAMTGITWWNMVDFRSHYENFPSGILRPDMSKKPVYFALDELINHQWKTKLTVKADSDGKIAFRGFRGTYRLTWKDAAGKLQEKTVELK